MPKYIKPEDRTFGDDCRISMQAERVDRSDKTLYLTLRDRILRSNTHYYRAYMLVDGEMYPLTTLIADYVGFRYCGRREAIGVGGGGYNKCDAVFEMTNKLLAQFNAKFDRYELL